MVRKICLDSDAIIQFLKNDFKGISNLIFDDVNFYTTSINVFEVWYGKKKLEPISEFLDSLVVYDFDKDSAILSAEIMLKLREKGEIVEYRDIFIAAICILKKMELLTSNIKHFERLKKFGLKLAKT